LPVGPDPNTSFSAYADPTRLVSTEWLSAHLGHPEVKVVESDEDVLLYDVGHIPGAVKIDWHLDLNDPVTATTSTARPSPRSWIARASDAPIPS